MKDIKKPDFINNIETKKRNGIFKEFAIALLIYFVGNVLASFIQTPAILVRLLGNKEYMNMMVTGKIDYDKIIELASNLPGWFMIVILFATAGIICAVLIYCKFIEKRNLSTLGFTKEKLLSSSFWGAVIGSVMFCGAFLICYVLKSVNLSLSENINVPLLVLFFAGFLVQGMSEEILCRGYLLVSLSKKHSLVMSLLGSSLFFSFLHAMNNEVDFLAIINLFLFGMFLGLLFLKCKNIWIVSAVHSLWNFVQGNVFGVSVSGMKMDASIFSTTSVEGGAYLNGGKFGLEGGMAVTFVLLLGVAVLVYLFVKNEEITEYTSEDMFRNMMDKEQIDDFEKWKNGQESKYGNEYQNMGFDRNETPWYPQEKNIPEEVKKKTDDEVEVKKTVYDKNYFSEEK